MAHVFIVNEKTLNVHLNYLFAGTGSKDNYCDFIFDYNLDLNYKIEEMLVSMIADISRIRENDKILFYLQGTKKSEGLFFGSFVAKGKAFLSDKNDHYLNDELGKLLTFRIKIAPDELYSKGITERECLDSLEGIDKPYQMCWSLIYRKLRANRGCTMITDYEYESIMEKIRKKNNYQRLDADNLGYNSENNSIEEKSTINKYTGKEKSLNIFNRLKYKYDKNNAFEVHLQAYIMQNLESIDELKILDNNISWIGNEMSCGIGMQSIDVIFTQENKNEVHVIICELKYKQPDVYIEKQIEKYVDWLCQYYAPTLKSKKVVIHPTIVAQTPTKNTKQKFKNVSFKFNSSNSNILIDETRYISFKVTDEQLLFKREEDILCQ